MNNRFAIIIMLFNGLMAGCTTESRENAVANSGAESIQTSRVAEPADTVAAISPGKSSPNFYLLAGDWVRTDGGYIISIRDIAVNGTFKAEYFNPKPIHVGRAQWEMEDNGLYLQVELQDVNYPGSLYTLEYLPSEDRLSGIYFQAVEGATYEVLFNRKR